MNWKLLVVLPALAVAPTLTQPAAAQTPGSDAQKLLQRIDELEQKVKILERNRELDGEDAATKAKATPVVTAGSGGFSLNAPDKSYILKVRGYVQTDARFFPGDHSAGTVNDTFLIRRLRPILEGTVAEKYDYRIMLDFPSAVATAGGNNPLVQDAYVTAKFSPAFQVQVGKFKQPVGLERLQSGANMLFIERAYPTQLLPNRDLGIQIQGDLFDGTLSYQAGIFNGVQDGGSGDLETGFDDEKDIAARLFANPFKNSSVDSLKGLGLGISGTFGNQDSAAAPRGYTSAGQQAIYAYTAATVADGDHWRLSPQGYYYYGPFGILGEYAVSNQKVRNGATFGTLTHTAWQVAASYFITGEDNSFKAVTPQRTFSLGTGGWGAWELTGRVSGIDFDDQSFPLFAAPATATTGAFTWGVGVNWHLNRNVKLTLNYEQTDFESGTSPLLRNGEQAVFSRVQFSF
ncbi:MAG: Porin precursor [Verrucomicrobiota bacterium]|jgi:phosphate-selective porin OprO/OprP